MSGESHPERKRSRLTWAAAFRACMGTLFRMSLVGLLAVCMFVAFVVCLPFTGIDSIRKRMNDPANEEI
ncbi:hypothetical protein SAMN05444145_10463 [Alistipes timonensis JC136]|uniref:Uncharacterized protein n=1 Tax=Alistipes timonensis JC136 TaxID=1033731 RepID=A0A1H4BVX7_9BACT|nr:hypothetical protein SAMN05444145_10463 [Alistipes timonensis JC136]